MKTSPTKSAAWEEDSFWREVVAVLTGGKKLRGEHYLQNLSGEELEQLRSALSAPGTLADQQKLCPARRGGKTVGELPPASLLSPISQAVREVTTLRALQRQDIISAATKDRCGQLGIDPQLTNAVVRIVAEEAVRQQAENQVGPFAISAANVLLLAEGMRTKNKQEEVKIDLKKDAEKRQNEKLKLDRDKFEELKRKASQLDQIKALRDPKAALNDADRKAIVDKVDEVLGIKKK